MLQHSKAFSGFSVDDLPKARQFYSQVLGVSVKDNPMGLLELHFEGNRPVMVYPKPDHVPATFTILNFPVENIDHAVDHLGGKGVVFEQYEGDIRTDEKGVCRTDARISIAWFKDPAGNILSVIEEK